MEDGESKVGEDVNIAKLKDTNLVLLETGPRCPSDSGAAPASSAKTLSPLDVLSKGQRPLPQGTSKIFTARCYA